MIEVIRYVSDLLQSNMYVIRKKNRIIIIDPFVSSDLTDLIKRDNLILDYILLTHEHYDHISGVNYFKERFDSKVICNCLCAKGINDPTINLSKYFQVLMSMFSSVNEESNVSVLPYITSADEIYEEDKTIIWGEHQIFMKSTPGHSKGSSCILIDNKYLFCGDSLLKDFSVVTKLKGGSKVEYNSITKPFFNFLPKGTIIYPGHFESFIKTI